LLRESLDLKVATINRILKRRDLIDERDSHRPALKRFERERPNQLWQMDFKGDYPVRQGRCYPLSILDDHSRFIVGLYALGGQDTETVKASLVATFERYGVPEAMLMDHGVPWWSNSNGHGLTRLSVSLIKQGIRLYFSGVRHPQTQGKVERFHRTLTAAIRHRGRPSTLSGFAETFKAIRREYNDVRPHESLNMAVPSNHYQPSRRVYRSEPVPWEYPEGSKLVCLNLKGGFYYGKRRHFVCEALGGEMVRLEEVSDKLLISYRQMYIREIDGSTGRSRALLLPVDHNQ
jgi:transposase InsO family protein